MNDSTRPASPDAEQEPGHYGAGYGEQVPEDAPPDLGPVTDGDQPPGLESDRQQRGASSSTSQAGISGRAQGDDGEAVVFTPADVHARPPDQPPTEQAPESEKAALIFERS